MNIKITIEGKVGVGKSRLAYFIKENISLWYRDNSKYTTSLLKDIDDKPLHKEAIEKSDIVIIVKQQENT